MRARLLKPGFFTNEKLARLPVRARLLFAGLWCLADREGRIEDRPERIKAAIFPYERVRIAPLIAALTRAGFVKSYHDAYTRCLALPQFATHQRPHPRESPSSLPPPPLSRRAQGSPKDVPSPSGSSVPRSGKDQDQCAVAHEAPADSIKPLTKIAHLVLDDGHAQDAIDELKLRAARARIPYDGTVVTKALRNAEAQRTKGRT
jgi:hypothetical protein